MNRATECLEALSNLFRTFQKVTADYERDCPAVAELGYLTDQDRAAINRARRVLIEPYVRAGLAVPEWLQE